MNWNATLKGFKSYLMLERSLSPHSIDAYLRDVEKLITYLDLQNLQIAPTEVQHAHLENFIFWLNDLGLEANSQARLISGLRAFYKYLLVEDLMDEDPTNLLEGPRLQRKIPSVLHYEEIQQLLMSIDLSEPQGTRNRAMLETLYASGLRVSELINLKMSNLFFDLGIIKVIGKGDKERLVPIGGEAIKHIGLYLDGVRRHQNNIHPDHENILFLNRRGKRLSRVMVFIVVKNAAKSSWY